MAEYLEEEKKEARNSALSYAIENITKNRHLSTIARSNYVHEVKEYILKHGSFHDIELASKLNDSDTEHWNKFYHSIIGTKSASELKIAYLSGPNPENDVEILVENGVLPENIWAFESDNKIYTKATISALDSKFPFIKIYKGRIENYLKILPFKFDIIYLDFCSTISSKKTISVIRDIFNYNKLNSPGVLVTNFSLPEKNENNNEYREKLNLLAANYLFPKQFVENETDLGGGAYSNEELGISPEDFLEIVKSDERTFYSQLITRLLYDIPSVIIPYQKLYENENISKIFFKNFKIETIQNNLYYSEDLWTFPNENSLMWGLSDFWIQKEELTQVLSQLKKQLSINGDDKSLIESIELVSYFITERGQKEIHSDKLEEIQKKWKIDSSHIFCDVFLFHQFKDILIGQLTSPYFYNVEYTKRWVYKAKTAEMFMDVVTYDQCRYIFDWMPTLDMFEEGVNNIKRQLSLRFAMDSIAKQRRWYNEEFFSGTAVIDQHTSGFTVKELEKRIEI
jgi:hypothetical protein